MKTKLFPVFVIAAGLFAISARAQETVPTADPTAMPQASQVVYAPRLPSAAELTNAAAAQGLTLEKIVQSASQMTVVFRSANGQLNTVAYLLLAAANSAPAAAAATVAQPATPAPQVVYANPAPATQVVYSAPATQVVYSAPAPAYYYSPYYYPSYYSPWYAPVSVSLGFGFGYYGGSYYHGSHYHGHGGYHGGHGGGHGGYSGGKGGGGKGGGGRH